MGQVFEGGSSDVIPASSLRYGELGECLHSGAAGAIVVRAYEAVVVVYSPHQHLTAFRSTWSNPTFDVRRLGPGERVILSNDPS